MRRAGLDYWKDVDLAVHESWDDLRAAELDADPSRVFLFSKAAQLGTQSMMDVRFPQHGPLYLVFGNEQKGLSFLSDDQLRPFSAVYFPMRPGIRSFNLFATAAMATWEAVRQRGGRDVE